jgi:hypothetical protein
LTFRPLLAVATLAVALATDTVAASATGTYSVFSCQGPTGAPNAAIGWTGFASAIPGALFENDCASGGTLFAALPAGANGGRVARWRFDAPPNIRIVRIRAARRTTGLAKSEQASDVGYSLTSDPAPGIIETCDTGEASPCVADLVDPIDKQGLDKTGLEFAVTCNGDETNTCSRAVRVDIASVVLGLADAAAPVVSRVHVVDNGDGTGVARLKFSATDVGAGLYRVVIKVDGKPFSAIPVAGGTCADADPADADPYEFLVAAPCPLAVSNVPVALDVRSLSAGAHTIEFGIEDAAGNAANVFGPIEFPHPNGIVVGGGRAAGGLLHARLHVYFDKSHTQRYTSRYGVRVVTRGILRARNGHGIRGARIDVFHVLSGGRRRLLKTGLKTRAGGKLTLILPLNVDTRRIVFASRAVRPGPVTSSQTLRLTVRRHGHVFQRRR